MMKSQRSKVIEEGKRVGMKKIFKQNNGNSQNQKIYIFKIYEKWRQLPKKKEDNGVEVQVDNKGIS